MKKTKAFAPRKTPNQSFSINPMNHRSSIVVSLLFLIFATLMTFFPENLLAEGSEDNYFVLFHDDLDTQIIENAGGNIEDVYDLFDSALVTLTDREATELTNHPAIDSVEPDFEIAIQDPVTSIDPVISIQEQWTNWGYNHINTSSAHDQDLTGKDIKVAILDTGTSTKHPDFNVTEGYNFVDNNGNYDDDNGHGSHVAGIIAAGQNTEGMLGIAPDVNLYVGKIMDEKGQGFHSSLIKGIEWAIEQEVDIINLSVGGERHSNDLERAITVASEHDIVLVGAAGNKGDVANQTSTVEYPAKYPDVIVVAAIGQNDQRATFSGYGPEVVVAAPGVNIDSTHKGTSYATKHGTSMAAPFVTGMIAIMKEAAPLKSAAELKEQLIDWTIPLGEQIPNDHTGYGRIQFPTEITRETRQLEPVESLTADTTDFNEQEARLTIEWVDRQRSPDKTVSYLLKRNGKEIYNGNERTFNDVVTEDGNYTYEVLVSDEEGFLSSPFASQEVIVRLANPYGDLISHYKDINEGSWYLPYIAALTERDLIFGYEDQTLRPNDSITRAEASVILSRQQRWLVQRQNTVFTDVTEEHYASGVIAEAEKRGLLSGYQDGSFRPNEPITRGELAVLFSRVFTYPVVRSEQTFTDVEASKYYAGSIKLLSRASIIEGYDDQTYRPSNPVSRAEFATVLTRSMK